MSCQRGNGAACRWLACSAEGLPAPPGTLMFPPPCRSPFSPSAIPWVRDRLCRCRFLAGALPSGCSQEGLWRSPQKAFPEEPGCGGEPGDEGLARLWLALLGGDRGKLGLREELWSFLCWAGFHLGKAEPCVPCSALVLLTGERGELGRGGRRHRDEPALWGRGTRRGHHRFWHSQHEAVPPCRGGRGTGENAGAAALCPQPRGCLH